MEHQRKIHAVHRRLQRIGLWVLFGCGAAASIAVTIGLIAIAVAFVWNKIEAGEIASVVIGLLEFGFGVAATLAVEFLWFLKTRSRLTEEE